MSNPLPKWLMRKYALLWTSFQSTNFSFENAVKILKKREALVSVILSELKKHRWLNIALDPEDSRKRIYKLRSPEEAISDMAEVKS